MGGVQHVFTRSSTHELLIVLNDSKMTVNSNDHMVSFDVVSLFTNKLLLFQINIDLNENEEQRGQYWLYFLSCPVNAVSLDDCHKKHRYEVAYSCAGVLGFKCYRRKGYKIGFLFPIKEDIIYVFELLGILITSLYNT